MASLDTVDMLAKEMCSVPTEAQTSASSPSSSPASGPSSRPMDDLEAAEILLYLSKSFKSFASSTPKDELAAVNAFLHATKSQTSEPRSIKALPKRSNLAPPRTMVTRSMKEDVPAATPASVQKPFSFSTSANQEATTAKEPEKAAKGKENLDAESKDRIARSEIARLQGKSGQLGKVKKVTCKACSGRVVNTVYETKRHYKIHLLDRPFKCGNADCEYVAAQKHNLLLHCRRAGHVFNY